MSWNHRLLKNFKDDSIGIHEVYYKDNGEIKAITNNPLVVGNDLEDLKRELSNINTAFDRPLLITDINGEVSEK